MARQFSSYRNSGQATTEFLVCLLVLIPMFFGVYYLARYADIKHSAIQASRYVAFERALDPQSQAKSASQLAQEARARFFVQRRDGDPHIVYRDTPSKYQATANRVPLWSDVNYQPLLQQFSDIEIRERDVGKLGSGLLGRIQDTVATPVFQLPREGVTKAEVTVSLADITHFDALRGIHVGMPGATAIGAGAWNSNGSKGNSNSTCNRVGRAVPASQFKGVLDIASLGMTLFEKHTPDIGRVIPDYVPEGSVQDSAGRNVNYARQDGNQC